MKRLSPIEPNVTVHGREVTWRVPPLIVAAIVRQVGETLRDHDETALDLLTAANSAAGSLEAYEAAFRVMARADLGKVEIVYALTEQAHDEPRPALEVVRTSYAQDDDGAATYRLCSSCHRLTADCCPGTPTTCASCAETRTR